MQIVLDTCVFRDFSSGLAQEKAKALAVLQDLRAHGATFVIAPQTLVEVSRGQLQTVERRVQVVKEVCDGILPHHAGEIMAAELTLPNPYTALASDAIVTVDRLAAIEEVLRHEDVQAFLQDQRVDNKNLKHLLDPIDTAVRGTKRSEVPPFAEFAEEMRSSVLRWLLEHAIAKGKLKMKLPLSDTDIERLWKRGIAYRLVVFILLANEYRRIMKTQLKGEGCMTDLRLVIESAYSEELFTRDEEFYACGHLLNEAGLVSAPRFKFWPDILAR
jgi:F0F1-type ATP synthase delta subunit